MGPITYSLCHTSVIGPLMWMLSLCAFPPPLPPTDISLEDPGLVLSANFVVPVDKTYTLMLNFDFPTVQDRITDKIIGTGYDQHCKNEGEIESIIKNNVAIYGKVIPVRVLVKRLPDAVVVLDKTFQSVCSSAHGSTDKDREVGYINLARGQYSIGIVNISGQSELKGIKTKFMLAGGLGKE